MKTSAGISKSWHASKPKPLRDINSVEGRPWIAPCGCWDDNPDCDIAMSQWDQREAGILTAPPVAKPRAYVGPPSKAGQ